jgi:serine/threonine-protein kinase
MNCVKCNAEIPVGSAFCISCGLQTGDPGAATVAMQMIAVEDPLLVALREELAAEYAVEKELGRGGMAIVYKAKEVGLERQVALKVLPPEMAMSGGTADRFKREARLAASLDHPHIIPIYRVAQTGKFHYMAMKFVEGRAVDAIIEQQGALPIPIAVRILRDAASGLAFAHERGIVHRDIKGGNILIDKDGRVLVSDFGIARAVNESALTASGMMVGTPNFMSPEQCGAGAIGPQSDQYSLGILAFQLLTAQLPFEADSLVEIIQHHYFTPPPDIKQVREEVPDELLAVINRALAKTPAERFDTTEDMVRALEAVPLSDEDKRDATAHLKALSLGEKVAQIRTSSLPPVKLGGEMGISGTTARPGQATIMVQEKRSKWMLPVVITGFIATAGLGGYAVLKPQTQVQTAAPVDSAALLAAKLPGTVEFRNLPPGAVVKVGDSTLTNGRGTLDGGATYPYTITAKGYVDGFGQVAVEAGNNAIVSGALQPDAQTLAQQQQRVTPAGPAAPVGKFDLYVRAVDQTAADILLDGNVLGSGSVVRKGLPAGEHKLRIRLGGFVPFDTIINPANGDEVRLTNVVLKPSGGQ